MLPTTMMSLRQIEFGVAGLGVICGGKAKGLQGYYTGNDSVYVCDHVLKVICLSMFLLYIHK